MSKISKMMIAGALAIATIVPATMAEAMPLTAAPAKAEKSVDLQKAAWCGRYRCGYRRVWRPRARVWVAPRRVWVAPRVIIRPAPRVVIRTGYSRHVRWCMNRYNSYDAASNTFVTYGGDVRRCRSPFRG